MTPNELKVTRKNIQEIRDNLPRDQANELQVGCRTWGVFYCGGQRGQMTVWPNGRGAVCLGGDSEWGDWGEKSQLLYTDDHDDAGNLVAYTAAGEQVAIDADGKQVPIAL